MAGWRLVDKHTAIGVSMLSSLTESATRTPMIEQEWSDDVNEVPNCPCKEAWPTVGLVYRRHDGTPKSNESYKQQGKRVSKAKRCQATSLSCYLDRDHLLAILKVHEDWADHIVQAELQPIHGVILQTGDVDLKHHSLWLRKKYLDNIEALFTVSQ